MSELSELCSRREGQAMVDRLSNLIGIFQKPELDFSKNRAENDDILGDAYEYLMRYFASQSGKTLLALGGLAWIAIEYEFFQKFIFFQKKLKRRDMGFLCFLKFFIYCNTFRNNP